MADKVQSGFHLGGEVSVGASSIEEDRRVLVDINGDGILSPNETVDDGFLSTRAGVSLGYGFMPQESRWRLGVAGTLHGDGAWNVGDWNKDGHRADYWQVSTGPEVANNEDKEGPGQWGLGVDASLYGGVRLIDGEKTDHFLMVSANVGRQFMRGGNAPLNDASGAPVPGTQLLGVYGIYGGASLGVLMEGQNAWVTPEVTLLGGRQHIAEDQLLTDEFVGRREALFSVTVSRPLQKEAKPAEETVVETPVEPIGDTDGDGIFDDVDKCVDQPEDFDGFEDEDGCPDVDNDKDGIFDATKQGKKVEVEDGGDKCPDKAETKNDYMDEDGCPDEKPAPDDIDRDRDGISNDNEEKIYKTNPDEFDTDGDGFGDGAELVMSGKANFDSDGDGTIDPLDANDDGARADPSNQQEKDEGLAEKMPLTDFLAEESQAPWHTALGGHPIKFTYNDYAHTPGKADSLNDDNDGDRRIEGGGVDYAETDYVGGDDEVVNYNEAAVVKEEEIEDPSIEPVAAPPVLSFCDAAKVGDKDADADNDGLTDLQECEATANATAALRSQGVTDPEDVDNDGSPNWRDSNADDDVVSMPKSTTVAPDGNKAEGLQDLDADDIPAFLDTNDIPVEVQRVVVSREKIDLKEKVQFKPDSAVIDAESYALLNELAQTLIDNPEILSIQIVGHTDDVGSASYNQTLSQDRAEAIVAYLKARGVTTLMVAVGKGESEPLPGMAVPDGAPTKGYAKGTDIYAVQRAANRRAEINILARAGDDKAGAK